jgi:hypothetical protein
MVLDHVLQFKSPLLKWNVIHKFMHKKPNLST